MMKGASKLKLELAEGLLCGTLSVTAQDWFLNENEQQNIYDFCGWGRLGNLSWDFLKVIDCKKVWKRILLCCGNICRFEISSIR